jgi:NAD(P)-dependent dehydrogenase (short-subunit alcohol dehydrogenase family)
VGADEEGNVASKAWFITGASRGFGRHWALGALRRGDRVAIAARDFGALEEIRDEFGDAALPLKLDITDRAGVFTAVATAYDYFGRLDVVVNNAGYGQHGFVEEASETDVRAQMETNFFGAVWVVQAALPYFRGQRSGHFLQVTSIAGLMSAAERAIYSASKFALEGLSEGLADEVKSLGIRVTLIEPGYYATGYDAAAKEPETMPAYADIHVQTRESLAAIIGTPSDPADTVDRILEVVDAESPPLRLLVGPGTQPLIASVYRDRLAEWEKGAG